MTRDGIQNNHPLIPILSRPVGDSINAVDARELHAFLGVGRDFATWIKDRIDAYGFTNGRDFEVFTETGENAGRPRNVYALSLDMAKELAMVERNNKGKQARAYFIECEKRARNPLAALSDPATLRQLLGSYAERVQALEADVEAARPKVEVYDRIVDTGDTVGFREAAKLIRSATGASENVTRGLMRRRGWIQRLGGKLAPAAYGETHGYVTTREREFVGTDGERRVKPELRITQKGVARAISVLLEEEME